MTFNSKPNSAIACALLVIPFDVVVLESIKEYISSQNTPNTPTPSSTVFYGTDDKFSRILVVDNPSSKSRTSTVPPLAITVSAPTILSML